MADTPAHRLLTPRAEAVLPLLRQHAFVKAELSFRYNRNHTFDDSEVFCLTNGTWTFLRPSYPFADDPPEFAAILESMRLASRDLWDAEWSELRGTLCWDVAGDQVHFDGTVTYAVSVQVQQLLYGGPDAG